MSGTSRQQSDIGCATSRCCFIIAQRRAKGLLLSFPECFEPFVRGGKYRFCTFDVAFRNSKVPRSTKRSAGCTVSRDPSHMADNATQCPKVPWRWHFILPASLDLPPLLASDAKESFGGLLGRHICSLGCVVQTRTSDGTGNCKQRFPQCLTVCPRRTL